MREGLEVVTRLLQHDMPATYEGVYFQVRDATLLPRPGRPGGPPILIGGNGKTRTLPLVAKYASEWNGLFISPESYQALSKRLDYLLVAEGRKPGDVRRSVMVPCQFGFDETDVRRKVEERSKGKFTVEDYIARGFVVGTGNQMVDQISKFGANGVQRIMLQWIDFDDLDGLEAMANSVIPQLNG